MAAIFSPRSLNRAQPYPDGPLPEATRLGLVPSLAHARLLEERPTDTAGEEIAVEAALALLISGQFVNVTLEEGRRSAAEVLAVEELAGSLILGLPEPLGPGWHEAAVTIDFTDVGGTYQLLATIQERRGAAERSVYVQCDSARRVQLRRFVRVPVLIAPHVLEVQSAPGEWRAVAGEIVNLSLGGIGLLVAEPLFGDARICGEFELPSRFGPLKVRGRVVEPPGPAEARVGARLGGKLAYRRGMAFEPLDVDDLRRLQRALYHRQVELRRLSDDPMGRHFPGDATSPEVTPRVRTSWRFWRH